MPSLLTPEGHIDTRAVLRDARRIAALWGKPELYNLALSNAWGAARREWRAHPARLEERMAFELAVSLELTETEIGRRTELLSREHPISFEGNLARERDFAEAQAIWRRAAERVAGKLAVAA